MSNAIRMTMSVTMLISACFLVPAALAQGGGHLEVTTIVQKEQVTVLDSGEQQKELIAASSVLPGDSVIYTITFVNVSDESAANVTITNPVPENLTYQSDSAFGPGTVIEFSVDGGSAFASATNLTVAENGEVRTAQAADYTHIRWVMQDELAAGAQGIARFRARLN